MVAEIEAGPMDDRVSPNVPLSIFAEGAFRHLELPDDFEALRTGSQQRHRPFLAEGIDVPVGVERNAPGESFDGVKGGSGIEVGRTPAAGTVARAVKAVADRHEAAVSVVNARLPELLRFESARSRRQAETFATGSRRGEDDGIAVDDRHVGDHLPTGTDVLGPDQFSGIGIDQEVVQTGATRHQTARPALKEDGWSIAGFVGVFVGRVHRFVTRFKIAGEPDRIGRPDGLPRPLVERGHERFRSAGCHDEPVAIDHQALADSPGDVLCAEPFEDVDRPDFFAVIRVKADHTSVGVHLVKTAVVVGATGPGAAPRFLPEPSVGRLPLQRPVEVEGEDEVIFPNIAGDVEGVFDDDGGRIAAADTVGFPDEGRSSFGPRSQEAGLVADPVTARAAELGPVGLVRSDDLQLGTAADGGGHEDKKGQWKKASAEDGHGEEII